MKKYEEKLKFISFPNNSDYLYTATCLPVNTPVSTGIIIVPPIGRERLRIYRELVILARALAMHGYAVSRFDYRGEGESSGEFQNTDIKTRVEDISLIKKELQENYKVDKICLIGWHLGALVALVASKNIKNEYMIFCDPVCTPSQYIKNMFRTNIVMQQ
ncbi:serine aminopeptidase domain-containing protein, partial [Elusimicrobiota bacterium]